MHNTPHMWDFTDAPLPYRAFTGAEGVAEKGVQYTYLAPLPFYTVFGFEVLQGENKTLFGADAASGAHAYTAFAKSSFDLGSHSTIPFRSFRHDRQIEDGYGSDRNGFFR